MTTSAISRQMEEVLGDLRPLLEFITDSAWAHRRTDAEIADFVFGNPHEMPLPEITNALTNATIPLDKDWFAYKMNEPEAIALVAEGLRRSHGLPFEAEDIMMTSGAFAGIATSLRTVLDPGDEVVFSTPTWFFYDLIIRSVGGRSVRVPVRPESFDLDLDAIAGVLTPRTRVLVVNTPHNPTGKIYSAEALRALSDLLTEASTRNGRTIYLLADESYNRIVFDGSEFVSPTRFYPNTFLVYTYGKTLLTPGFRIGYTALPPTMPERETVRGALWVAQVATGWAFPNAMVLHALGDLERLSIDIAHLQRKRDRMVAGLREIGYRVSVPEGTFYLMVESPCADDVAFAELLTKHDVLVLPGALAELPGHFRISLTASDDMIERGLLGFARAFDETREQPPERSAPGKDGPFTLSSPPQRIVCT